jgi:hypothetical protein
MIKFQLTNDWSWIGTFSRQGWADFVTPEGVRVLVMHGGPDGSLRDWYDYFTDEQTQIKGLPDCVVCCHPKQVAEKHPRLKVIGDWTEETTWTIIDGYLCVMSSPEATQRGLNSYFDKSNVE